MPFPQVAKDNLVVALSLANLFTDYRGRYFSLQLQIEMLHELQRYIGWQAHNLYQRAIPGRSAAKQTLGGYLKLESTVDLFMRYMEIPTCQIHTNLAYLSENVQKLIYQNFKQEILRDALHEYRLPPLSIVDRGVRKMVEDKVQGYLRKLPEQSREEWQLFVAEINVGIEVLCRQYKDILSALHGQFYDFRRGQLAFIQNYFDRCMFLAKLEEWLNQVPLLRSYAPLDNTKLTAFCEKLLGFEHSPNEIDLRNIFPQLAELQKTSLTEAQYKTITEALVQVKPKYDAYRLGQDSLTPEAQVQQFITSWPKPRLPLLVPPVARKEADQNWNELRAKHREMKEKEVEASSKELKHKQLRPAVKQQVGS